MKKITILMSLFLVALSSCSKPRPTLSDRHDDKHSDRSHDHNDDDRHDGKHHDRDDDNYDDDDHGHWWN